MCLGKQRKVARVAGPLAFTCLDPGRFGYLGSRSADGRDLSVSPSLQLCHPNEYILKRENRVVFRYVGTILFCLEPKTKVHLKKMF